MGTSHPELHKGFSTPQPEFSPVPIWWWSGEQVRLDRLCWQLDQLVDQGVHNMVVLNLAPTGPLYGALSDEPKMFTAEWWQLWEGLCDHAGERGARLWFYDQIGFSGANLQGRLVSEHPEFSGITLQRDESGEVRYLRQGFDYLSPQACAALLDTVHGEFERRLGRYLGSVIVGSFQDELPTLPTWSATFSEEFAQRAGYRIEPELSALWEGGGDSSAQVRLDYQRVRAELAEEAFFRPLHEWHGRYGLTVGVDQQSPSRAGEPIGSVRQYADYARTHRWFGAPGSDHHGEARIHSSLAHHYQRPRTWIESFHSSGWGGTLEETFDWLVPWLLAGATLYDPHAVYYSTRGGWFEWAPPSTCWRQPYWKHYKQFADAVSRLCWLLTRGSHECDVGVLFPSTTVQAGTLLEGTLPDADAAHRSYLDIVGRMVWYDAHPGVLDRCHRDFDVLDDDTVGSAQVVNAELRTRDEAYKAVVLPSCPVLEPETARTLRKFAESGGLLVAVGQVADSLRDLVVQVDSPEDVAGVLERLGRSVDADGPALHRTVGDRHVLVIPAAAAGTATAQPMLAEGESWVDDIRSRGYDFDPDRFRTSAVVRLHGRTADLEQWDPQSGRVLPVPVRARGDDPADGVEATVEFDAPLAVLVWRESDVPASAGHEPARGLHRELHRDSRLIDLGDTWKSDLVPTIDNRHADLAIPASTDPFPVQQWRLGHSLDEQEWQSVLVGHGTFAWCRRSDSDPWEPVRFSLTRGIENDPVHLGTLGPKGRVPEDFWRVDDVRAGQCVELRTSLPWQGSDASASLVIAANGARQVWWNDEPVGEDLDGDSGYQRIDQVHAEAGANRLRIRVTAEEDGALHGSWALTTEPEACRRPAWLAPGDVQRLGTTVRARGKLALDEAPVKATLQLGTEGPARLYVNDSEIAVQGAFEPYGSQLRVLPYDVTSHLRAGDNLVEVELTDVGRQQAVLVDGVVEQPDGSATAFVTDRSWELERDGTAIPLALRRRPASDPRWALLRPRPHPLPGAAWLEPGVDEGVLPIVPDAGPPDAPRPDEWFRLTVPPGATSATLPTHADQVQAWVDGALVPVEGGTIRLPEPEREARELKIRIEPFDGRTEGALWNGPIEFTCGVGRLRPRPWAEVGLGSYSGGVRYRRDLDTGELELSAGSRVMLDLGAVRGTTEVSVNGSLTGVRVWSPYRFDLTEAIRPGVNELEVTVFNTLAPYLDDASPTQYVFPGQRLSGMLGPVRLEVGERDDR